MTCGMAMADLNKAQPQGQADESEPLVERKIVRAFSDFLATDKNQLSFKKGELLNVLQKTSEEWWWAECDGCYGYIPVTYVNKANIRERDEWQDEEYFDNYSTLKLQQEMLSDEPRMLAFYSAIQKNVDFIQNKVVLDVGCGTGVLSLFCAKHGKAKKVYAVERSEMADIARKLVHHNGCASVIRVIEDLVEDIHLENKVDLIISEWMGTILLFEMMIESVIMARDKFLIEGGTVWPSDARLHLVPCSAHSVYEKQMNFWGEHFGIDFSSLRENATSEFLGRPLHSHHMSPGDALADHTVLFELDMSTVTIPQLECIEREFDFKVTRSDQLHGFCSWFSTDFAGNSDIQHVITLNTGPHHPLTHWKQNLFLLDKPLSVEVGDRITGRLTLTRNPEYRRHLHVTFSVQLLTETDIKHSVTKIFKVWR